MLMTKIKGAQSPEEVRNLFTDESLEIQHIMLTSIVDMLNKEVELDIIEGNNDLAIYKMSQVVMFEDERHVVERVLLKQGTVNYDL